MNLHPVIVHFPIALLTVYALLEVARVPRLTKATWYVPVKTVFLLLGWLGAVAAATTGLTMTGVATLQGAWPTLVATHKNFAFATAVVFGVLAVTYGLAAVKRAPTWTTRMLRPPVVITLALLGLCCVTITGALGGAMVYGADVDPVVHVIYNLFVGK